MERKTVYHDADGYRRTLISDDDRPNDVHVHTELLMDPILQAVQEAREAPSKLKHFRHVAKVPMTVYEKSILEEWDESDWQKWLNARENEPFRVWKGRV